MKRNKRMIARKGTYIVDIPLFKLSVQQHCVTVLVSKPPEPAYADTSCAKTLAVAMK